MAFRPGKFVVRCTYLAWNDPRRRALHAGTAALKCASAGCAGCVLVLCVATTLALSEGYRSVARSQAVA